MLLLALNNIDNKTGFMNSSLLRKLSSSKVVHCRTFHFWRQSFNRVSQKIIILRLLWRQQLIALDNTLWMLYVLCEGKDQITCRQCGVDTRSFSYMLLEQETKLVGWGNRYILGGEKPGNTKQKCKDKTNKMDEKQKEWTQAANKKKKIEPRTKASKEERKMKKIWRERGKEREREILERK